MSENPTVPWPSARRPLWSADHFCAGLSVRVEQDYSITIVVIDYFRKNSPDLKLFVFDSVRLPGGSQRSGTSEPWQVTLLREWNEEVFDENFPLTSFQRYPVVVHQNRMPKQNGTGTHTQYFCQVPWVNGRMRTEDRLESPVEKVGPPREMLIEDFISQKIKTESSIKPRTPVHHRLAAFKLLQRFGDRMIRAHYSGFVLEWQTWADKVNFKDY